LSNFTERIWVVLKQRLLAIWLYVHKVFANASAKNVAEIGLIFIIFAIDLFLSGVLIYLIYGIRSLFFIELGGGLFLVGGCLFAVGCGFSE
jgi:ABC-type microcin C transport system permease subunit YejB